MNLVSVVTAFWLCNADQAVVTTLWLGKLWPLEAALTVNSFTEKQPTRQLK